MKKFLEDIAAAAAFAEAGQWDVAESIMKEVRALSKSKNKKFLFLANNRHVNDYVYEYVANLSGRLNYDVVFVLNSTTVNNESDKDLQGRKTVLPEVSTDNSLAGEMKKRFIQMDIRGAFIECTASVHSFLLKLVHLVKGIEFILVEKNCNEQWNIDLSLPVFFIEAEQ